MLAIETAQVILSNESVNNASHERRDKAFNNENHDEKFRTDILNV